MKTPYRILVVGVGSIGLRHLRCFQNTGRAQMSICEVNASLRTRVAEEYHVEQCYSDLEAALADRHDAAVIAAPAHWHVPMATRLAEAGLHLLIEKPLSISMDGVESLRQAVTSRNLVVTLGYDLRATPPLRGMRDAIVSGRFGRPVQVAATCGQHFPTYRPAYRDIYYRDRATGGGAIQDAATHIINAVQWMVGPADRLVADAAHQVLDGVNVEDTVHLLSRHGDVLVSITLNQYQAPGETTITVVCDKGTARYEGHLNRWRWMIGPDTSWHDEVEPQPRDGVMTCQANMFLDAIEGTAPPLCSLDEGIETLRANLAALTSLEQGTWQTVAPPASMCPLG